MTRPPKASPARDKTDRTDKTPSRAEAEAWLDANLPWILEFFESMEDVPAPHVLLPLAADWGQLLLGNPPQLTDDDAWAVVKRAATDPYAFDAARYLAGRYLAHREAMPPTLHAFACGVLLDKRHRPKGRSGRPRDRGLPLRLGALHLVHWVHHRGGIPLGENRHPNAKRDAAPLTAFRLVADAMKRAGRRMTARDLESLCYDAAPKHAEARALFEALGFPAILAAASPENPANCSV